VSYAGYVQCFCDERASVGDTSNTGYGENLQPICQEYMDIKMPHFFASNSITIIITVIN